MIDIMQLRNRAKQLEPVIRIGKNGLTDSVITEINKQLRKKKLIKVKFLKSMLEQKDKKEAAKELAEKTNSILVEQVGFVVVLFRDKTQS